MNLSLPKRFPLFILASSVCRSLQCVSSALTQGGKGGHLFMLTCSAVLLGGRTAANKHHWHVRGALAVRGPPWVCPAHACALSRSTLLRLQAALQGNCAKWALGCVHFPGLSCSGSGSRVLHTGTDSVGLCFVPFPALSSSGDQVLGKRTLPRCCVSYYLSGPSCLVSWVCSCISGVLFVSSGELISGCDPSSGYQPFRISGSLWLEVGSLFAVW